MAFETETKRFVEAVESCPSEHVLGWVHDRTDPDSLGFVALSNLILRQHFDKSLICFYSKKIAFFMNRQLAKNFIPSGVLRRIEEHPDAFSEALARSSLILVGDVSNPEIVTGLNRYLKSEDFRADDKRIVFVDHHEKVVDDLEDLPNVTPIRVESAQSTSSLMIHIMRNLGLSLDPDDETQLKAAVVAKLGIDIDLTGYAEDKIADSVKESLAYLNGIIGDRGDQIIRKLKQIRVAQGWYGHLASALRPITEYSPSLAVCGLGVLDDNGILPFVANELMKTSYFNSVITFGIVYDQIGQHFADLDLEASGRSRANLDIALPDLFAKVFVYTDAEGRRISRGGGRTNEILGEHAGAGASIPLAYWREMKSFGIEKQKRLLTEHAWPVEFERVKSLLIPSVEIRPDQIIDASLRRGGNGNGHSDQG